MQQARLFKYIELSSDEEDRDLAAFRDAASSDTLKDLGPMSREEYEYYEKL
ncbi:MAG: hypothetical protein PHU71_03755 [Candidatus Gracilibacteria bacterium]|nr:hypothetical protein [Candidatus Gracilibacteria bacterium]